MIPRRLAMSAAVTALVTACPGRPILAAACLTAARLAAACLVAVCLADAHRFADGRVKCSK